METIIVLLLIIDFLELGALICAMKKLSDLCRKPEETEETVELDDDDATQKYVKSIEGIMNYDPYR